MILVGSGNPHKLREIREVLAPLGLQAEAAADLPAVEETGTTFADNAALKARAFAAALGAPCLADDSGLVIPALEGEPGVRSARYAGVRGAGADDANIALVLRRLRERGLREPEAWFQCSLALAAPGDPPVLLLEVEGRVRGRIVNPPRGRQGFGYDPIFFHPPSGATFGELAPERKNAVSHRAEALRELARRLPALRHRL